MLSTITDSPIWALVVALVVIAITQRMIAFREKRRLLRDRQMNLYLDSISDLSRMYNFALTPKDCASEFLTLNFEMLARFSIIGTEKVMDAYGRFSEHVAECIGTGKPADPDVLTPLASSVTYAMCCDVHGERHVPRDLCDMMPPPPVIDEPAPAARIQPDSP